MGEEFYSVIKLTTGEEIFALVSIDDNDGDPLLVMQNPVTMKMSRSSRGMTLRVKPWMEIPDDDFFIVKLDKIITMTEVKDESMIEFYNGYLEEGSTEDLSDPSSHKTKLTNKMGYVSTVEEAREMLENLYKLKDNKES
jgi:hypothetical protein